MVGTPELLNAVKPRYNEIEGAPQFARYNQYFVIAVAGICCNIVHYFPETNSRQCGGAQQSNHIRDALLRMHSYPMLQLLSQLPSGVALQKDGELGYLVHCDHSEETAQRDGTKEQ